MKKSMKALSVILVIAMMVSVLAGCGATGKTTDTTSTTPSTSTTTTTTPSTSTTTTTETPAATETTGPIVINVPFPDEPGSLDPGYGLSTDSSSPRGIMYEALVRIYDNVLSPGLAESWDVSEDGTVYTFHLRDSKWSDGEPVTAQDFVYGFQRLLDPSPEAPNGNYQWMGDYIKNGYDVRKGNLPVEELGVRAIDDKTFEVTASSSMPYFVDLLKICCFYPVRQDIAEKYGKEYAASPEQAVCCGPFTLTKWDHDSLLVFEKNEGYWNAANINVDQINAYVIHDAETIMNMYDAGELDMIPSLSKEYIQKYVDSGDAIKMDGATIWYCAVNCVTDRGEASKLTQNNNFRKALAYLIPREQLVAAARGDGSFGITRICPENMSTSYNDLSLGEFCPYSPYPVDGDMDKAVEYFDKALAETGLTKDTLPTLTLLTFDDAAAKTCAEVIQSLLSSTFGLNADIDTQTYSARQEKEHAGDYDLCITNWAPDYNDPMTFLECFSSTNSYNTYFGGQQNAEFDALIAESASCLDLEERATKMFEAEKIACEELAVVPLFQTCGYWAMKPYLTGINKCGFGANDPDYAQVYYIGE